MAEKSVVQFPSLFKEGLGVVDVFLIPTHPRGNDRVYLIALFNAYFSMP